MVTISCLATNILLNVNLESRSPTSFPRGMIGLKIAALWNVKMFLHSRLLVWPRYSQHLVICSVADGVWDNYGIKTEGGDSQRYDQRQRTCAVHKLQEKKITEQ